MAKKQQQDPTEKLEAAKHVYLQWAGAVADAAVLSTEQADRVIDAILRMPPAHYVTSDYVTALAEIRINQHSQNIEQFGKALESGDKIEAARLRKALDVSGKSIGWEPR